MRFLRNITAGVAVVLVASAFVQSAEAGKLRGKSGHKASGNANVVGSTVKLGSNFRFDGGPDVFVAVKENGKKLKLIGKLRRNSGAQSYSLPAGTNKSEVKKILLWCRKFNAVLGTANTN